MRQKSQTRQTGAAKAIKDIRRATRKQYSAEEKIRIVLDGLRGEESIVELCRREGIAQSIYYKWSKCPSPLKLGHYFVPDRGDFDGSETTFRRGHSEAVA